MSILNPLFDAVAWIIMRIHAVLSVPFGASSGWAWGLSIVILVMLMRLLMVPLFVKQVNAQRKMQAHMPQLQEIRKRYKNDKQRLNEETMKFYKENGINPLGGCLPLVAQLPVFWALFNVLRAISDWQPGQVPKYGLTVPVVESAKAARIFGASLADKFLFPLPHETLLVVLVPLADLLQLRHVRLHLPLRVHLLDEQRDHDQPHEHHEDDDGQAPCPAARRAERHGEHRMDTHDYPCDRVEQRVENAHLTTPWGLVGTGSYPPGLKGWHRASRRTASHSPRTAPCRRSASRAYSLQEGANRHLGGRSGLMKRR